MLYVVWASSGPVLVTEDLVQAVKTARTRIAGAEISKLEPGKVANPYQAVIFWRKPDKSTYKERWVDESLRQAYEAKKAS